MKKDRSVSGHLATTVRRDFIASGLQVFCLGYLLNHMQSDFFDHARQAAKHTRHAVLDIDDAVRGGPEGYRSAQSLEEAMQVVMEASHDNDEAAQLLKTYAQGRDSFAKELSDVYAENETLARLYERTVLHFKGGIKNAFDAGNSLKTDWWKENIDNTIVVNYGKTLRSLGNKEYKNLSDDQIIIKALEKSERLSTFYEQARTFYDNREAYESSVADFCTELENVQVELTSHNDYLESLFPRTIANLKLQYETEDGLFALGEQGINLVQEDLEGMTNQIASFGNVVDGYRSELGNEVDLKPVSRGDSIDAIIQPYTAAFVAVMGAKGIAYNIGLRPVDALISRICNYPIDLPIELGMSIKNYLNRRSVTTNTGDDNE